MLQEAKEAAKKSEQAAAAAASRLSLSAAVYEHWSWLENAAFVFSIVILLSSYAASVLYVFRIDTGLLDKLGLTDRLDQEWVTASVDLVRRTLRPWVRSARATANNWTQKLELLL